MKPILLFLTLLSGILSSFAQTATMPAGSGTAGDPYRIATLNNLYWIVAPGTVDGLAEWERCNKHYKQTANIDASSTSTWESGAGWRPIGNALGGPTTRFQGTYHGQGYTISGLYINRPAVSTVGLFGLVSTNAVISYVGLENVNMVGKDQVGGLIGYVEATTTISNCYTTGTVSTAAGNNRCGGLIGIIAGAITVTSCYSTCSVTTGSNGAGLIGEVRAGASVSRCYATGNVHTSTGYSGGLVGYTEAPLSDCFARGNVTCTSPFLVGGLVGYSSGGTITNCYSTGTVPGSGSWIGGLTGYCSGATTASFFDSQTAGTSSSHTGTARTTAQMTNSSTFSAWNLATVWEMTAANNGYPSLIWQNYIVLPVTIGRLQVKAAGQWVNFFWETLQEQNSSHFEMQASVNGQQWNVLGTVSAAGQSSFLKKYEYQYKESSPGVHYYRIRMVDFDGTSTFSSVATLQLLDREAQAAKFNNPVRNGWLEISMQQDQEIRIFRLNGEQVSSFSGKAGVNRIHIASFSAGIYILMIGEETYKIVKQ